MFYYICCSSCSPFGRSCSKNAFCLMSMALFSWKNKEWLNPVRRMSFVKWALDKKNVYISKLTSTRVTAWCFPLHTLLYGKGSFPILSGFRFTQSSFSYYFSGCHATASTSLQVIRKLNRNTGLTFERCMAVKALAWQSNSVSGFMLDRPVKSR